MKVKKGCVSVQVGLEEEEEEYSSGSGSGSGSSSSSGSGSTTQRFVIPISYLYHPLLKCLLDRAYEIYGYQTDGPLKLPCSVDDFVHLRWQIEKESTPHQHHHHLHHRLPHALHFHSC